ncbi:MAG: hypothetical protein NTW48_00275, partial [Chloroflexi bacterium]|nr:hypothetical protein [Chloroflexota bacterium]
MADVKAVTNASMFKSSEAVTDFQKSVTRDSAIVQAQSKAIANELKNTSTEVTRSSQVTAESVKGITTSADASVASLKGMTKGLGETGRQLTKAMGPEAAAQMQGITDKVEEFVATRVAIAAVGLALGAVAGTIAGVGYAAFKAGGFLVGLMTGSSYKSENIDAVIKLNDKILDLQKTLQMTAADAVALNDVIGRLGINKSDITEVYGKAQSARSGDKSEFDRLGVGYKNSDGSIVDTTTLVTNAKVKLDEYTEGWDRNQAAIALSLGSYEQINSYLQVNQQELQKSKDRLNAYYLSVGPEAQKFISDYQQAMRDFKNELTLMGEAMSRIWSDQVMPAYTTFATSFKDGWPSLVAGVRHVVAAFTSLGYGLKMTFDIAYDALEGFFKAYISGTIALSVAAEAAMGGNFSGAKDVLIAGWEDARKNMAGIGSNIASDAEKNLKAMQLAQGKFGLNGYAAGAPGSNIKSGKPWEPKPKTDDPTTAGRKTNSASIYDAEDAEKWTKGRAATMAEMDAFNKMLEAKANEGDAFREARIAESTRLLEITEADKQKQYIQEVLDRAEEYNFMQEKIRASSPWLGMKDGLNYYAASVADLGKQFDDFATNSMRSVEDALVNMTMTGKASFKDMANSIIADMVRIATRQAITAPLSASLSGLIGNMFSGGGTNDGYNPSTVY